MAKLSNDGTYVTVESGDTLWDIAKKYLGAGNKYQELADINGISDPNKIYVGQKIYLTKDAANAGSGSSSGSGTSSTGTSSTAATSNMVDIIAFGLQSNSDNTLFAAWKWGKEKETDHYLARWEYDTGDDLWFWAETSVSVNIQDNTTESQSTYNIPSNAKNVRFTCKPVSKTYTKNNKETTYWTASWASYRYFSKAAPLTTPGAPTVEIEKYKLTAKLENIQIDDAKEIEFQVYKNDSSSPFATGKATISATDSVSYSCTVDAGGEYKVRCRAVDGSTVSEWSNFSSASKTIPAASSEITVCKANSKTSVYLEWTAAETATSYNIEYTTKKEYFDGSDQTTTKTGIEFTHYEITGLETGSEYFFRVCAVNDKGQSAWTDIKSVTIGTDPSAPTTWSSTTTCIVGEKLILYWVHNSEDGSSQKQAELEIYVDNNKHTYTIKNTEDEDEKDKTSSYEIDTTKYTEGTKIRWRVRTSGVTNVYGEWSVERTVDIYAPPTLELRVTDVNENAFTTLRSFPFYVYGLPGPNTQAPIGYQLTITADESYETIDEVGNKKNVNRGEAVYSSYFDIKDSLLVELSANNVDLQNGVRYTVNCAVSMNSGLTAEANSSFTVAWTDEIYIPNAEIGYDEQTYVTHIHPYCVAHTTIYRKVEWSSDAYITTNTTLDYNNLGNKYTSTGERVHMGINHLGLERYYCAVYVDDNGNAIDTVYYEVTYSSGTYTKSTTVIDISTITPVYTSTGEEVFIGVNDRGDELYYCMYEKTDLIENVTLSVYRREFDGSFTELATGLNNTSNTFVTDPHPALDYARYRIVAITKSTGAVSYYDVPGYPIGEIAAIIQWNEEWSNFDTKETSEMVQPPWTGSLLRLPYNIDVSDSNTSDVTLVKYIGRKRPVSYYGTQLGEKSTWNIDIAKSDRETLYGLRRLAIWMGDVYVREPSGTGYWANISVSFSQKHCDLVIPVTLDITRVEGGA
jgi:hypothetical protein